MYVKLQLHQCSANQPLMHLTTGSPAAVRTNPFVHTENSMNEWEIKREEHVEDAKKEGSGGKDRG